MAAHLAHKLADFISAQRIAAGLSSSALAQKAGVSRTVLTQLQRKQRIAVQTDVIDRLLNAVAADIDIVPNATLRERERARSAAALQSAERRYRHLRLAVLLATDSRKARTLIARARVAVDLWRTRATCSPGYIKRWEALLALPPKELARAMTTLGDWENALFQNSPWGFAWS
jgi:transcriptional regulator with XRE-family HTH domain